MTENYNKLTPAETERLAMLSEEAGEIVLIIGKILRHGLQSYHPDDPDKKSNKLLLINELNDLGAVVQGMIAAGDINKYQFSEDFHRVVWQKKLKWTHHQQ